MQRLKIIFAGLDNAGKTSFLIALRQKYNFYEYVENLKPTLKIDYNSFPFLNQYLINLWDMGGQEKYRNIYINHQNYFFDSSYFYFLIDIQDELRFDISIKYLHQLLDIFRKDEMKLETDIVVCFNKYDPKFKKDIELVDRVEMLKELIIKQNPDMKFVFFSTSYYDISSLSKALSYSLSKLLNLENINKYLEELVRKFNCSYAILYSDTGLIISDYYSTIIDYRDFDSKICRINKSLEFFQRLDDENVNIDEKIAISEERTEYVKKFKFDSEKGKSKFYLGVCAPSKNINSIKLELEKFHVYLVSL